MDNYLSSRWPTGPGGQPIPTLPPQRPNKGTGRVRRMLLIAVCIVLGLGVLSGASFLGMSWLVSQFSPDINAPFASSARPGVQQSKWSQDDLPWGEPDPDVELSLSPAASRTMDASTIYEQTLPSVVYIVAQTEEGRSTGTGVIASESGYVISNYHIIDGSVALQVMLLTDQTRYYEAQVIGFDEEYDLAVLKFEADGLISAALGDSDQLAVGDPVYAIGNPMGYLYGSMTEGIVSALDRENVVDSNGMGMIQTSAALNLGNSGGALVDAYGQVVGITSAKITGMEADAVIEGLGLAIPMSDLLPFVNRILATGQSWRPTIGVTCLASSRDGRAGILIETVKSGAPADTAGLLPQDLIISANGQPVPTVTALRRILGRVGVDGVLTCTVLRGGQELELSFALIDGLEE